LCSGPLHTVMLCRLLRAACFRKVDIRMLNSRRLVSLALSCLCALSPVAAHAIAVPPVQQVLPAASGPITFATAAVGGGSSSVSVQLLINVSGTLTITAPSSANAHVEFTVGTITGCTANGSTVVAAASTCTVPVTFTPYYPGQRSQPLIVTLGGQVYSFGMTGAATGSLARLDPTGLTTFTGASGGAATTPIADGGPITSGTLYLPEGIATDSSNNVYIADGNTSTAGNVHTRIRIAYQSANPQLACLIITENPTLFGLATGSNTCVGATSQPVLNDIYSIAGSGAEGYTADNVLASSTPIDETGVAVDAAGNVFIADGLSNRIRVVYQGGANISCLIVTENPTLFGLTAGGNTCVGATSLPTQGFIYTIAGTGTSGVTGDGGLGTSATLMNPNEVAVDSAGDVFTVDFQTSATPTTGGRIRVLYNGGAAAAQLITVENPTVLAPVIGDIYTVAGSTATTETGDKGLATSSGMLSMYCVRIDGYDNVYIADKTYGSGSLPLATVRIRVVYNGSVATSNPLASLIALENPGTTATPGYIYTIAGGTGTTATAALVDGVLATASNFAGVYGIALDAAGDIIVADRLNYTIRRVSASTGLITTIAGAPSATQSIATGLALGGIGKLWGPWAIAVDSAGGMYAVDNGANRVRVLGATSSATYPLVVPSTAVGTTSGIVPFIETNAGTPGSTLTITTDNAPAPFGFLSPSGWLGISDCQTTSTTTPTTPSITSSVSLTSGSSCGFGVSSAPLNAGTFGTALVPLALTTTDNSLNSTGTTHNMYATVTATGVTTTLTTNPASPYAGSPTQLIATLVNGTTPVTCGTVSFSITGGASLGSATLDPVAGTATVTTSLLVPPTTSITTVYAGSTTGASCSNALFTPSTSVTVLTVAAKPVPVITISASPTAINAGSSTLLTATVTATSGTPTGTVTITTKIGTGTATTVCSTTTLAANGIFTCSPTTLVQGTNVISATYGGDNNFAGASTTTSATVVVTGLPTTTTLTVLPVTANLNQTVTMTATISGLQTSPALSGGNVTFKDTFTPTTGTGATLTYGPVTVNTTTNQAVFTSSTLAAGTHVIVATFANDSYYTTSTSASSGVTVVAPGFYVTLVSANGTAVPVTTPATTYAGIAVQQGLNGLISFSVQSVGGYTGTVTPLCDLNGTSVSGLPIAPLPATMGCLYNPANFVFTSNTTSTGTVAITTQKLTAANRMANPILAVLLLPGAGLALFSLRRRAALKTWQRLALFCLIFIGGAMAVGGLSGCGNGVSLTPKNSYLLPITFSDGTTTVPFMITVTVIGN